MSFFNHEDGHAWQYAIFRFVCLMIGKGFNYFSRRWPSKNAFQGSFLVLRFN